MDYKEVKKRVAVSVSAQIFSQVVVGAIGVVILKIMTSNLDIKSYGIYATIFSLVSTFSLLTDLGVQVIAEREIAIQPARASEIISHNLGLRLTLSLVIIPLVAASSFLLYPSSSRELHLGTIILAVYLIFDTVWATCAAYFAAQVRNEVTAFVMALQQTLFLAFAVTVAVTKQSFYGFVTAYVLSIAISSCVMFLLVRRDERIRPRMNITLWRKTIVSSIPIGIISIINIIYFKADSLLLSLFKGTASVGIYTVAYSVVLVFAYLATFTMDALLPSMSTANEDEIAGIIQKAFHFMVIFACLLPVIGFEIRDDVIVLVSNRAFIAAAAPFSILILATSFSYLSRVFRVASIAIGKYRLLFITTASALVLNIGLNCLLIPHFGLTGAACATAVSELFVFIAAYWLFRKQTGITVDFSIALRPMFSAAVVFLASYWLRDIWTTNSVLYNTVTATLSLGILYFGLLYILSGLPAEITSILRHASTSTFRLIDSKVGGNDE